MSEPLGLLDQVEWRAMTVGLDWADELLEAVSKTELSRIRLATHTGRPLASDSWLSKLEKKLGRRLRAPPPRPAEETPRGGKIGDAKQVTVPSFPG